MKISPWIPARKTKVPRKRERRKRQDPRMKVLTSGFLREEII